MNVRTYRYRTIDVEYTGPYVRTYVCLTYFRSLFLIFFFENDMHVSKLIPKIGTRLLRNEKIICTNHKKKICSEKSACLVKNVIRIRSFIGFKIGMLIYLIKTEKNIEQKKPFFLVKKRKKSEQFSELSGILNTLIFFRNLFM